MDTALRDIAASREIIERSTDSMDCHDFREDPNTIATVEYNLEAISDTAIRLGEDAEHRCPGAAMARYPGHGQLALGDHLKTGRCTMTRNHANDAYCAVR